MTLTEQTYNNSPVNLNISNHQNFDRAEFWYTITYEKPKVFIKKYSRPKMFNFSDRDITEVQIIKNHFRRKFYGLQFLPGLFFNLIWALYEKNAKSQKM